MSNQFLSIFQQFVEMQAEDVLALQAALLPRELRAGEYLIKAGQVPEHITVVQKGLLRKFYIEKDKERNSFFAAEGSFIVDYPAYLQKKTTNYYIQALEDSTVYTLHSSSIEAKYKENPKWDFLGRKIAEDAIIKLQNRLEHVALPNPKDRYNLFLSEYPEIFKRLPQYHIASYLGIEPQSLSRIKSK